MIKPALFIALAIVSVAALAQTPAAPASPAPMIAPVPTTTNAAYLAANCANCHGSKGQAVGGIPSLAGLKKDYIVEQMKAFKEGKRQASIMHQLSKGYTDEQVALMAEFFSKQKAN